MNAPNPPDESERLLLLHALNLLDSAPEPIFDRVTRLVARVLDVPIALVSLVDKERQWFKSKVGLEASETPRELAFCAHAILGTQPLVIPDATDDDRFRDNPLVTSDPNIRFYAGVPLRSLGGLALGTLCAIDDKPRQLSQDQLEVLRDLADMVSMEVQVREALLLARTQMERSQDILQSSEARFRAIFELASVGIAMVAPDGGWVSVNKAICDIVGYTPDELKRLTFKDITHPDDLTSDLELLKKLVDGEIDQYQMEKRYLRKNGGIVWASLNVTKKVNGAGELEYFVAILKNIDARKKAEASLSRLHLDLERRVEDRTAELNAVIEQANDAYISINERGAVTAWNRHATKLFGWPASEAIGKMLADLIIPEEMREKHRQGMARYLSTGQARVLDQRVELPAIRRDGSTLMVEIRISAIDIRGKKLFSAFLNDITERKQREEQREYEARHDTLTGLMNRRGLSELLPAAQARADRARKPLGLLFIDLDGFKGVNDTYGHQSGDIVLRETAGRLKQGIRETDTAIRLSGDEFTIVLENLEKGLADARMVAEKVLADLIKPIDVEGGVAKIGASIGIAIHQPGSGKSVRQLIAEADGWMYQAKEAGKGRVLPEE